MVAPRKVLLDTNFLLIPGRFGVDIFSEIDRLCRFPYRLCILRGALGELKSIASGSGSRRKSGKDRSAASVGLKLLARLGERSEKGLLERGLPDEPGEEMGDGLGDEKSKNLTIIDDSRIEGDSVDDRILSFAVENQAIVATQDGALKRRLRAAGIPVFVLRQRSRLALEGFVSELESPKSSSR